MTDDTVRFDKFLNELKNRAELYQESPSTLIPDYLLKKDFEMWKMRMKNEGAIDIPRTDGFVFKTYNNVQIIIDRYPENSRTRVLAIDAVRHPNGPRCRSLDHVWLSQLTPLNIALQGRERGEEEFEKKVKELMVRYKGTLDRLAEDD